MTAPFSSRLQFSRVRPWFLTNWGIGSELLLAALLRPFFVPFTPFLEAGFRRLGRTLPVFDTLSKLSSRNEGPCAWRSAPFGPATTVGFQNHGLGRLSVVLESFKTRRLPDSRPYAVLRTLVLLSHVGHAHRCVRRLRPPVVRPTGR